uniref:Uncharacterized protein n=1 Tax=Xenopsylla cheopis TaxID=163159 RepID=A0A6M2DG44_XENCH
MDIRRSTKNSKKQTKDVKINGKEIMNQNVLCTPPQRKSCKSNKADESDELYYSEDSSPVLLSTQEGGRGCEVIWDWRSPNRNSIHVLNITPKAKDKKPKFKLKNISPLLHLPSKQFRKPVNTQFIDHLQAQLADIQRRFNANKANCIRQDTDKVVENISYVDTTTESQENCGESIINENKIKQLSSNHQRSPDISELLKDDSDIDLLIECSQVAEIAIEKDINLTKLHTKKFEKNISSDSVNKNKSLDLFMNEEDDGLFTQVETPKIKSANKVNIDDPQRKIITLSTPKKDLLEQEDYINDDSFDAILSTLSDEALLTTSCSNDIQIKQNINNNEMMTQTEITCNDNITKQNISRFNIKGQKSDTRSSFSRHNSMPVSPRIVGSKYQVSNAIGRHSSMPYPYDKNQKPMGLHNKQSESTDSLYNHSSPPIQCTPEEIEKKRQIALKRKEAIRIRNEIEKRRLEAIEKLQMKKSNHKICK